MGSESRLWDAGGTDGKFLVLSTSGRPKEAAHREACEEEPLEAAVPLWRGKQELGEAIRSLMRPDRTGELDGCTMLRIESRVAGIGVDEAIMWLRAQQVFPRSFFLNPDSSLLSAGAGGAHVVKGDRELQAVLLPQGAPPCFRYYGGSRFDSGAVVGEEWNDFGGHFFLLPRLELVSNTAGSGNSVGETTRQGRDLGDAMLKKGFTLAVNVRVCESTPGGWPAELAAALAAVEGMEVPSNATSPPPLPASLPPASSMKEGTSYEKWAESVESALEQMREGRLRKVVLARNYLVGFDCDVEPFDVLLQLRSHHGYLFCLQPQRGSAFLGCSPEPLFRISPDCIETMAIAGTRPRGGTEGDDEVLAQELLASGKDMLENEVTSEYIEQQLTALADDVTVSDVFVMKLRHVQHLARRIRARPKYGGGGGNEASATPIGLLRSLNPTPAVCGESRPVATEFIRTQEVFDRGFYGGPVGFVSSTVCEFCVAIRSVLCQPRTLHVFAGAGMVPGSSAADEWEETAMKMRNVLQLVSNKGPQLSLSEQPNVNALWATMLIEELIRCGVDHFCVCPGSRSTPLAVAIARNTRATHSVFHDERSAGFYCVGYARGKGRAAGCVVTSGTAVANLLPSVVEASQQGLPLLVLAADRPPELRGCGSNQTIHQPGIFGPYVRWEKDVPCPTDAIPAGALLSDAGWAVHCAHAAPRGPVHLNLMFRENLAPDAGPVRGGGGRGSEWNKSCLDSWKVEGWVRGCEPYTRYAGAGLAADVPQDVLDLVRGARRGVVVAGMLSSPSDRASAAWLAAALRWPLLPDVQSGLRTDQSGFGYTCVPHVDQVLTEPLIAASLRPDVVLQLGERVVSKRLGDLVAAASEGDTGRLVVVSAAPGRNDPALAASHYVAATPASFAQALGERLLPAGGGEEGGGGRESALLGLGGLSLAVQGLQHRLLLLHRALDEPYVAFRATTELREGAALFLSASMPVRDADMFLNPSACNPAVHVASNRGASGIDGVVSSAVGYAAGLGRPVTLLIGDGAALHDLSALRAVRASPQPLCLIVVNNGGCGIFSFLPIAKHSDVFDQFFDNPHDVSFQGAAAMFGLSYRRSTTTCEFDEHVREAQRSQQHFLIEAVTPQGGAHNVTVHRELGAQSAAAARAAVAASLPLRWSWEGDARRPVALLLHGFLGCKEDWAPVVPSLCAAGWSCLAVDLPGHGGSAPSGRGAWVPPVALSAEWAAHLLEELLGRLGIEGVALVGYSMGGRVAMRLASRLGGRVGAMVLVGAHPGLEGSGERRARMVADEERAEGLRAAAAAGGGGWRAWLEAWYEQPLFGGLRRRGGWGGLLERRLRGDPALLADAMVGHSVARQPSFWGMLRGGAVPVLYVAGGGDVKYRDLAEGIGGGVKVEVVEGVGHAVLEEDPRAFARAAASFLAKHLPGGGGGGSGVVEAGGSNGVCPPGGGLMIAGVSIKRFRVPLVGELALSKGAALTSRAGLVVEICTMGGQVGFGECTPLPGFHPQTVSEVEKQLQHAAKALQGRIIPLEVVRLDGCFDEWLFSQRKDMEVFAQWHVGGTGGEELERGRLSPCALAALEAAVLQVVAHACDAPLSALLARSRGVGTVSHIRINELAVRSEGLPAGGWSVCKVKVGGPGGPEADAERVRGLAAECVGTGRILRLDANQAWGLDEAARFAELLGPDALSAIEYIEEPLSNPGELEGFFDRSGLRYALDESIEQGLFPALAGRRGLAALVVKPSVLGGAEACLRLKSEAGAGVQVVVSSAFETSLGLAHMASWAGVAAGGGGVAHGLGTYGRLREDLLSPGLGSCVREGMLDVMAAEELLRVARHSLSGVLERWNADV